MRTLIRGRLLSFHADPTDSAAAHRHVEDGALVVAGGCIAAVGDYADLRADGLPEIDHRPHLILPGFIDPHIHFPQLQVTASWGRDLLDWLNRYTFPEESRFANPDHAAWAAGAFLDELARAGTTTASVYASSHAVSADALLAEADRRGLRMNVGRVMMDRNAPPGVLDTAQSSYDDSAALARRWHGHGRLSTVITPRFAITSSPAQMAAAQALAQDFPDCPIQTHLSENGDEIALTLQLYPDRRDYLDIYDHYGLLGPRSLMGHCLHLSDREIARMADTGTRAISCPTSNLFLGSGLFDRKRLHAAGIVTGVATDIGGGTDWSMLRTLGEAYKVSQMRGHRLHPLELMHWATRGNALAMGLADRIGTLDAGSEADLVVLDARATPAMRLRMDRAADLADELFVLTTMGDDRAVVETYAAGRPLKKPG